MKNLIFAAALGLAVTTTFGQTLKKGNLLGVHSMTVTLDPDVTMNQFKDFYVNKVMPEMAKSMDAEVFMLRGIRGEWANKLGTVWVFKTEAHRNKYFKEEGGPTELGQATFDKLQPTMDELAKLGSWTSTYTDWLVQ